MDGFFVDNFSRNIWERKYAGEFTDVYAYFRNLARILARANLPLENKYADLLFSKRFSPGGRILAFAGRPQARVSLMNCTTHQIEDDSLEAINKAVLTVMRASSRGQGIGIDISKLRPIGSPVNNAANTSTGSVSFMEMLNAVSGTIGQEGRRAALLFSIGDTHPDLWRPDDASVACMECDTLGCVYCDNQGWMPYDFLHVKKIPGRVENANISVKISDEFMRAVLNDLPWQLKFGGQSGSHLFQENRTVRARDLFYQLAKSAHGSAEPGVLYWDTAKRMSNTDLFGYPIVGVNACSEETLDQDGVCNLGSMNLAAYVMNPFSKYAYFDYEGFYGDVMLAVRFLDDVLETELERETYISDKQRDSIIALRRIGLGVMGLADMLARMGLSYSDNEATLKEIETVFSTLRDAAYESSILLAISRGPAKAWEGVDRDAIVEQAFFATLPEKIKNGIKKHGTRNITILSIAPTGSISNLYGVSSGIEPLFARQFERLTRINGNDETIKYAHPGVAASRAAGLPDSTWQTAYEVSPIEHIAIQAKVQEFVDTSIAKTVNFPATATIEDVYNAYLFGWSSGLKGMSVYVDQSRHQQVLNVIQEPDEVTCPLCDSEIIHQDGCSQCSSCEWSVCSV